MTQPTTKYFSGGMQIAEWENEREIKGQGKVTIKNYTIQKNYNDKNDQWQTTNSYSYQELGIIQDMIRKIRDKRITEKQNTEPEKTE